MSFKTIVAPHVNVNDLEMTLVCWHFKPWQHVNEGDVICDVESTKSVLPVEADCSGYIYPLIDEKKFVKVGEPLAHVFKTSDQKQIDEIQNKLSSSDDVVVSKKAKALMSQFGLELSDFPKFASISSETVIAKIREMEVKEKKYDKKKSLELIKTLDIDERSVAIYGEKNQALLALDVFKDSRQYKPVAYINSSENSDEFYGLPLMHNKDLNYLIDNGLKYIYICGQTSRLKKDQRAEVQSLGFEIVSAVHPSAVVSSLAKLGEGVFIGANAVIGPDVDIGGYSQILCGATVAHHCKIGKYTTITDGVSLGGNVLVGDNSLIGIGVNVNKRIKIGKNCTVVSGATVVDNIPNDHICRIDSTLVSNKKIKH